MVKAAKWDYFIGMIMNSNPRKYDVPGAYDYIAKMYHMHVMYSICVADMDPRKKKLI
jgi:hypothetical protein